MELIRKNTRPFLLLLHLVLMAFLYFHSGINLSNEGNKYLGEAGQLIHGDLKYIIQYDLPYLSYIIYISALRLSGIPPEFIVILSWLIFLFSALRLQRTLSTNIGSVSSIIFLAALLLSPMISEWHLTLYSETFYMATAMLFISLILDPENKRLKHFAIILTAILLVFCRPGGIFIVLCGLHIRHGMMHGFQKRSNLLFTGTILAVLFAVVSLIPFHYGGIISEILSGSVYCGFPKFPLTNNSTFDMTLFEAYREFIQQHGFSNAISIFMQRFISFYKLSRPHFSIGHNFINVMHYMFYLPALITIFKYRSYSQVLQGIIRLSVLIILFHALLTMIFFNEWSERYTVQVFPFIIVIASLSLTRIIRPEQISSAV